MCWSFMSFYLESCILPDAIASKACYGDSFTLILIIMHIKRSCTQMTKVKQSQIYTVQQDAAIHFLPTRVHLYHSNSVASSQQAHSQPFTYTTVACIQASQYSATSPMHAHIIYTSNLQPEVHVPPGVYEDIVGVHKNILHQNKTQEPL
jgi:hypothetical protein